MTLRHRPKIFTTNNHYEWSKLPDAPEMPYLQYFERLINIVVEKLIIPQQTIIVVQIILGNKWLGRMGDIIHLDAPAQISG
jgi:hypothetical protein